MQTMVTKRLSVVRKLAESNAFATANATKPRATIMHIRLSKVASRFINPVSLISIYADSLLQRRPSVFGLTCGRFAFRHFFVATSFTLPDRISPGRIRRILLDRAIGRDNFSSATRTNPAPGSPLFNVDAQEIFLSHKVNRN